MKLKKYENDEKKEKFVHDTLVNNIIYDINMLDDQSAYGAFVDNKAICTGYAKSFQVIMMKLGIPTYYIADELLTNEGKNLHVWNLIQLDGKYYNVDVTLADQINEISYNYYNVSDSYFSKDHIRTDLSINLPKSL